MTDRINGTSVYLLPGMSVKLKCPVSSRNYGGFFAAQSIPTNFFDEDQDPSELTNGFVVENSDVGEIVSAGSNEGAAVVYTHKKAEKNSIWFFAETGERTVVNVVSVPIHDHSTIVQGGPAYGTYFSDDEGVE